jgi:hypothetical protein
LIATCQFFHPTRAAGRNDTQHEKDSLDGISYLFTIPYYARRSAQMYHGLRQVGDGLPMFIGLCTSNAASFCILRQGR